MEFGLAQVILAFGGNIESVFGAPKDSLQLALQRLNASGVPIELVSSFYRSPPMGPSYQADFINLVAVGRTRYSPSNLLRHLKDLERAFGRRGGLHWGPRPLDIDIIAYERQIMNWPTGSKDLPASKHSPLILPHPRLHVRPFVLLPLDEILPEWRHPVFHMNSARLMALHCVPGQLKVMERLEKPDFL